MIDPASQQKNILKDFFKRPKNVKKKVKDAIKIENMNLSPENMGKSPENMNLSPEKIGLSPEESKKITEKSKKITEKKAYPKKDDIRTMIIRGHKRACKDADNGIIPKKSLNKAYLKDKSLGNPEQVKAWNVFLKHFYNNRKEIQEISNKVEDPIKRLYQKKLINSKNNTEMPIKIEIPKIGKKNQKKSDNINSFNDKFCASYFVHKIIRESFKLYIDYLFVDDEINSLINRFNITCCLSTTHLAVCKERWAILHDYIANGIMKVKKSAMSLQKSNEIEKIRTINSYCQDKNDFFSFEDALHYDEKP